MKKIILITLLITSHFLSAQNKTELKGFVKNIDIDTLVIAQSQKDIRSSSVEIPVQKGKMFKYSLKYKYVEAYSIVFKSDLKKGAWRPIIFFPNNKIIEFELYPTKEYDNNKINGDNLREQQLKYEEAFGKKFIKLGDEIYGKIFKLKKDSDEYNKVKFRLDSLNKAALAFQHHYFLNDNSILGLNEYVSLLQNADRMLMSPEFFKDYQDYHLRKRFDHPLNERAVNLYAALSDVKAGQQFVDVVITDRKNRSLKLSELIGEKNYVILDLWAPWCGPCIKKSKLLKQHYQEIKVNAKIVGVVGGINNIKIAETAINQLAYPWENYFEISEKNRIWEKYGIAKSGGAQFVIDRDKNIITVNPTIMELLKIINSK